MCSFQVRFTEKAVKTTVGEASAEDVITEAGWYGKWPWPIQAVDKYDARTRILETHTEQTATHDKKPIIVTTFCGWRIKDPYQFRTSLSGGVDEAVRRLREIVETHQKEVIGQYDFSQLVSKNPEELKFDEVGTQIRDRVNADASAQYGIAVVTVGIKRLQLPEDVTKSVFESMKAERRALASRYQYEGESERNHIVATAESLKETIMAFANRRADAYRAEGNRRAAEYYKTLQKEESLALFLDRLKKLKEILKDRTTVVLKWDQVPFTEFKDEGREVTPSGSSEAATTQEAAVLPGGRTPK
jgi:membrane protease subunit HflC